MSEVDQRSNMEVGLEELINLLGDGVLLLQNGRVKFANAEFLRMSGYPWEEIESLPLANLLDPPSALLVAEKYRDGMLAEESPRAWEVGLRKRDEGSLPVEAKVVQVRQESGILELISFRDISDRRQADDQLQEAARRYRAMFDNPLNLVFVNDDHGLFLDANDCAIQLLGYTREELDRVAFQDIIHPDDLPRALAGIAEAATKGHVGHPVEARVFAKSGETLWIEATGFRLSGEGEPYVGLGMARDITDRKRWEEKLRGSEERSRALIENLSEGIMVVGADGRILYENPSFQQIGGYTVGDVVGRIGFEIIHPEDVPRATEAMSSLLRNPGGTVSFRCRYKLKDGAWGHVEAVAKNLLENPAVQGIVVNFRDITERKRAEEELQRSEERFRTLIEDASDGIMLINADLTIAYESPSSQRMTGAHSFELVGKSAMELVHPEDVPTLVGKLEKLLKNPGVSVPLEARFRRDDGSLRYGEAVAKNLLENPAVRAIVLTYHDVTDKKRAEGALRESEERFRALIENASDGIAVSDYDGTLRYLSPSVQRITGYKTEELVGKSIFDLLHPDDMVMAFEPRRASPGAMVSQVFRLRHKYGSWRWVESVARNLLQDPNVRGIVSNFRDITDRKRAEEELQRSEERFRTLIEDASDGIMLINADLTIGYESPSSQRMTGFRPGELIGKNAAQLASPDDVALFVDRLEELIERPGGSMPLEAHFRRRNGSLLQVEVLAKNLLDNPGVRAVVMNFRDVTDRKQAEEALRESEERFRTLTEQAWDAVCIVDRTGLKMYESPAVERILGFTSEEMKGKNVFDFLHPDDLSTVANAFTGFTGKPGEAAFMELRLRHKDGSYRWVSSVTRNLLDDPGIRGIVTNYRDITEQRKAEHALRESERKFRTIFEKANDAIVYVDTAGKVIDLNGKAEAMYGYARDEIVGVSFLDLDLFATEEKERVAELYSYASKEGMIISLSEMHLKHCDGHVFPVEVSTGGVLSDDGVIEGFLIIARDISEREIAQESMKRYAAELARSNQDLEQFAYVASHDLQEPLRMVGSYVQLLAKRYKGKLDSDADDFIGYAVDGVSRMHALIDGLLAYSRVSTRGKEFEPVESEACMAHALANLQMVVEDSGAVIARDSLPKVMADPVQLGQVFQNLLGNALKFRKDDEPPHIQVSAQRGDKEWLFSVRDNGIGFEQESADRLFVIFSRMHHAEKYPGTGIGLAVCKKIIERHGGRIWAESQPGMGATFYFTLPIREMSATAA